jgi:hypothetical protein
MSKHDTITALAGCGKGRTRALAPCVLSIAEQVLGTDDMNAYGRAGTRGGGF